MTDTARGSGSVRVLTTPSFPGHYPVTAPENVSDEAIADMIRPILVRHGGHASLPPLWLLVMVYRNAWLHWRGPRRHRFAPAARARQWALHDCDKCVVVWVGGRPDNTGAWRQHMHLADWRTRTILVNEDGSERAGVAPVSPEKEAAIKAFEERKAMAEAAKAAEIAEPPESPKKIDMRTREGKALKEAGRAQAS